jgi:hypothetical protein
MRARVVTVIALALLALGVTAWVRSYLPEYGTLRAHRGSLVLLFYGQEQAQRIDPANNPSVEETFVTPSYPGRPPRRRDTRQVLENARAWASAPTWQPGKEPLALSWAGFELIANSNLLSEGYFVAAAPFWALCPPPAIVAAWGLWRARRERAWRRQGRCRRCGYDLRGSSDTCPECGAATVEPTARAG